MLRNLYNQHSVAEGKEPILLLHRRAISVQNVRAVVKRRHQHEQRAFRQVKIGDQAVNGFESISGIDENSRIPADGVNNALLVGCAFQGSTGCRTHRD